MKQILDEEEDTDFKLR